MVHTPEELREEAEILVARSYCPYSKFRVAAILEDSTGELHRGVNVENGSFGLTICAERNALFAAVTAGARSFNGILVHSPDGEALPCGACREVLAEFCDRDLPVLVSGPGGVRKYSLGGLLPHRFQRGGLPG